MELARLLDKIKDAGAFTISLHLLFLYCASLIMFFGLHKALVAIRPQLNSLGKASSPAAFLTSAGSYLALCWAFLFVGAWIQTPPRIAMLLVPMIIMGEFSYKRSRAAGSDASPVEWAVFAGVLAGIAGGIFLFYRDAPLK